MTICDCCGYLEPDPIEHKFVIRQAKYARETLLKRWRGEI